MITIGIDLSSMPPGTAACQIVWRNGGAVAGPPLSGADDAALDNLISGSDAIGIDAPFGWPSAFASAVNEWTSSEWNAEIRDQLRFRETDRTIHEKYNLSPLSVSSDRIALPAMRAMAMLKRHGVTDRSGDGKFFEAYPAGSLRMWDLPHKGYKQDSAASCVVRKAILQGLRHAMPWLEVADEYMQSADDLDSLVAALTTRAAAQGLTRRPETHQLSSACREGWIHLPIGLPRP